MKKKQFFLVRWFKRAFMGAGHETKNLTEEQMQTPMRTIMRNFREKKSAMFGLITFLLILVFVLVGPYFWEIDLSESESTLTNLAPSQSMLKLPSALKGKVADIGCGRTFGVGIDTDGHVYTWGNTRITDKIDISNIPDEVQNADIVHLAVGDDHAVALDVDGNLYVWGNTRLQQDKFSSDMTKAMKKGENWDIVQLEASNQFSGALSSEGTLYLWGNTNNADIKVKKEYQGNIAKFSLTGSECMALLKDGTVVYAGSKGSKNPLGRIPAALEGKKVVDIATTSKTVAAVTEDGEIVVWGNVLKGEDQIPEMSSHPVKIYGGRNHYTAMLEDGTVLSWGDDSFGQASVPAKVEKAEIKDIYVGYMQNYAVTTSGDTYAWGLKGFVLGTDDLGRDMLTRIINGGRVTMLVGAISVIIATIIGVVTGGLAGYFGGNVDILIMRIAEIVGGLPFIPFAMILSAVIGSKLQPTQRMYLIMVVLGVLSWTGTCRLVRAQILAQREMEYVTAAKAMGIREVKIVFKHILPNVISLLLVSMTLDFATCMLTESTLSYLGFGIPLPTPTWGNLLTGANNSIVIQQYWWRWVFPAAIFGMCTICINLMGDGLRDAVDPKSNGR